MKTCIVRQSRQLIIVLGFAVLFILTWHTPLLAEEAPVPKEGVTVAGESPPTKKDLVDFVFGLGYVYSPDYYDAVKDAYPRHEVSGGYGWADLHLGARFNLTEQLSLTPGADLLINFGTGDVSFTNTIFIPSLSGRFILWSEPALYLRGEVNYGVLNIGADFDADSKGIGYGAAIGYTFGNLGSIAGVDIEIGYLYIPVDVEIGRRSEKKNFGGILFKCIVAI